MRSAIVLIMALIPFQSFAGVGGGGVGPRPTMFFSQNADLIRTLEIDNDKVTFLYKPFDGIHIEKKTIVLKDINEVFLEAIIDSRLDKSWKYIWTLN